MALQDIQDLATKRWMAVAMPDERIFALYLGSALIIAFLSWLYYSKLEKDKRPENADKGFWAYVLNRDVYLHKSAVQDYLYFFANGLIYVGIISQLLISTHFFMLGFHHVLEHFFGLRDSGIIAPSIWTLVLYTVFYALLLDFAIYITHLAQHKVPILWEFHKVHHSAEVLTPITLYRMHPVDLFFSGIVASLLAGFGFAGFYYLTGDTPNAVEVMGVNVIVFAFYLLGYNLRHSHVWLNYPHWLSHILVSPAQHQVHHSTDPKHFDKNLGLIFAFWDKLFGTLYVPRGYEKLSFGINKKKPNPFNNVIDMYIQPFKNVWKIIKPDSKAASRAWIFVLVVLFCAANYTIFLALDRTILNESRPLASVHIAELTWTEVQRSLDDKTIDTIIIPTAGIEQNGPHMILGKHHKVVYYTSGEIAKRLGKTLVAPVIDFVPEDVHMDWAGTISVPEKTFEGLLEATAQSYIKHGFKYILFIGDSGGNQEGQKTVAAKLAKEQKAKDSGVTVANIGDYYSGNGQFDWLLNHGYTKEQIGGHAGIRDTSEIMLVDPDGIRHDPWYIAGRNAGYNGDPTLASRHIGKIMTELKIKAALKQIRKITGKDDSMPQKSLDEALPKKPYK